jgi:ABC-2 type transport system permease protein
MFQLRPFWKLFTVQGKLYLREPISVFFSLLFAPLFLLMVGLAFGNEPVPEFGGRGTLDVGVPTYAALVICVVGLPGVAIETATRRELGVLRRFRATPLRPLTYIVADVLVSFAITLLGILLLFLLGRVVYGVRFEGNLLALMAGISLSAAAFLALGYVLASVVPNVRVATVLGNALLFPMIFLAGITVPLEVMPETVHKVARFVPLRYVVTLLRGLWFGEPLHDHLVEVVVLGGVLIIGTAIAAWKFRWE